MPSIDCRTLRSENDLDALEDEWNDLALRSPDCFLSQTFQWARSAWRTIARPRGRSLNIVTLRANGQLVALWPLVFNRQGNIDIIRPLGSESSEYCAPLVEAGSSGERLIGIIWREAKACGDLILLPQVRAESRFAHVIRRESRWIFAEAPLPAPFIAHDDYADWSVYLNTISTKLLAEIRRKRRRLGELGDVTLERKSGDDVPALLDWILDHKRAWLTRANARNEWLSTADYRDFLLDLSGQSSPVGSVALFVLNLDGKPVAAHLSSVDQRRVESFIGVYDEAWAAYGPGQIVTEYCLRWAFERGLDFDFRIGAERYKYEWATRTSTVTTFYVATSWRGWSTVAKLHSERLIVRLRRKLALGRFLRVKRSAARS